MAKAIEAVRSKSMGYKKACKQFGVPKTTLMRLCKEKYGNPETASKVKYGRPTVLPEHLEKELVKYCLEMEASFFGISRDQI
jgi:helix-turn-helix, Psq domain.